MKNNHLYSLIGFATLVVLALGAFMACDDDDSWDPSAPPGWNTFYDRRLNGCWELEQANGRQVYGMDVNYLDFYGNGRGRYFYYTDGQRDSERMAYWCQDSYSGVSNYQMNIKYEYSSPSTVNYWFTDSGYRLWMQWGTGGGVVTYVYRAVDVPGW